MTNRLSIVRRLLGHYKYLIVTVVGVAIVGFIDENSFRRRIELELQISDMRAEIKRYRAQNEAATQRLRELRRDPRGVEKIARERYFMKTDNEDIFVLSDDEQSNTTKDETTK